MAKKLSSRKFWAAVVGIAVGIVVALLGADTEVIVKVSGAVMAVASAITYIVVEGKIDAEAMKKAVDKIAEAVDALSEGEKEDD